MRHTGGDLGRRQAAYNEAFEKLRQESRRMQGVLRDANSTEEARAMAQCRVEDAHREYRACRDRLAETLGARPKTDLRELAYLIWESSGRPWGNSEEHWHRAEALLRETPGSPVEIKRRDRQPRLCCV